jgi:hypothetical protein
VTTATTVYQFAMSVCVFVKTQEVF